MAFTLHFVKRIYKLTALFFIARFEGWYDVELEFYASFAAFLFSAGKDWRPSHEQPSRADCAALRVQN